MQHNPLFKRANPYLTEGPLDAQALLMDRAIAVRCPHCGVRGTFFAYSGLRYMKELLDPPSPDLQSEHLTAAIRQCPNEDCHGIVFTLSLDRSTHVLHPPEVLAFDPSGLPANLVETLREAIHCHAAGAFRASVMMVRRLLEELCEASGAEGRTLHARLEALRAKITLPADLFDAIDELKALGNDAAHIEAKVYQNIDREESELSVELAQEILRALYQHKGLVDRLNARRSARETS